MKKLILVIAVAGLAMSCKKVPQGGNPAVLKLSEDTHRYSDDGQGAEHEEAAVASEAKSGNHEAAKTDSTAVKPKDSTEVKH